MYAIIAAVTYTSKLAAETRGRFDRHVPEERLPKPLAARPTGQAEARRGRPLCLVHPGTAACAR